MRLSRFLFACVLILAASVAPSFAAAAESVDDESLSQQVAQLRQLTKELQKRVEQLEARLDRADTQRAFGGF